MAAILLIGIVGYTQLPVSALPEVDYPTIRCDVYPGASPTVVGDHGNKRHWSVNSGTAGPEPDDVFQFWRNFRDRAAVRSLSGY